MELSRAVCWSGRWDREEEGEGEAEEVSTRTREPSVSISLSLLLSFLGGTGSPSSAPHLVEAECSV